MDRDELRGMLRGIIAATTTPFDDGFEVDYGRMAELTHWWVESGLVAGKVVLKVASVMGEVPQLADHEWPPLVRTVVQAANGRVHVMVGTHGKDTKRTIDDVKRAQDLGAVGMQIAPPVSNDPNQDDLLRYYGAISDAVDIGIMVYHTHWLPFGRIEMDTFVKMKDFEHVVAVKWNSPEDVPYEDMRLLTDAFNILDNSNQPGRCYENGGHGFLDEQAVSYPPHDLKVLDLLEAGRYDEGQALWDSVSGPLGKFYAKIARRSGGQARLKKGVMAAMGHPVGAMRPPSEPLSEEEEAELRELLVGFGWPVPGKAGKVGAPA